MRSHALTVGRTFAVAFDHGEDFLDSLAGFCEQNGIHGGYIPMFLAGFSRIDLVGTCELLADPAAPVWSKVQLSNAEVLGCGTLATDPGTGEVKPHIHVSAGLKQHSATGYTSHLLGGTVQFLTEMVLVEVLAPAFHRIKQPDLYDVPLLRFM